MDDILSTVLQILGVSVLLAAAFLQRRSASTLRDVKDTTPKLLEQLSNYLVATPSTAPLDLERLEKLEREAAQLRRMLEDLDESTSRRFKRLQARARRDEPDEDDEPEAPAAPRAQMTFPFAPPAPTAATPGAVPAGLPRLERIGR